MAGDNEQLMRDALAAIQKLERENARLRDELTKARAEATAPTLGDAIAKVLDPQARKVSKSRAGRIQSAEDVRKASENGVGHDITYSIRAKRLARIAELEKRR